MISFEQNANYKNTNTKIQKFSGAKPLVLNCPFSYLGAKLSVFNILVPNCPFLISWCPIVRVPNCPPPPFGPLWPKYLGSKHNPKCWVSNYFGMPCTLYIVHMLKKNSTPFIQSKLDFYCHICH